MEKIDLLDNIQEAAAAFALQCDAMTPEDVYDLLCEKLVFVEVLAGAQTTKKRWCLDVDESTIDEALIMQLGMLASGTAAPGLEEHASNRRSVRFQASQQLRELFEHNEHQIFRQLSPEVGWMALDGMQAQIWKYSILQDGGVDGDELLTGWYRAVADTFPHWGIEPLAERMLRFSLEICSEYDNGCFAINLEDLAGLLPPGPLAARCLAVHGYLYFVTSVTNEWVELDDAKRALEGHLAAALEMAPGLDLDAIREECAGPAMLADLMLPGFEDLPTDLPA